MERQWDKSIFIMTIKKPTSLTEKHPNNLGTVRKIIFSIITYERKHCTLLSKIHIRHKNLQKIIPRLANNDIPLQGIIYGTK